MDTKNQNFPQYEFDKLGETVDNQTKIPRSTHKSPLRIWIHKNLTLLVTLSGVFIGVLEGNLLIYLYRKLKKFRNWSCNRCDIFYKFHSFIDYMQNSACHSSSVVCMYYVCIDAFDPILFMNFRATYVTLSLLRRTNSYTARVSSIFDLKLTELISIRFNDCSYLCFIELQYIFFS